MALFSKTHMEAMHEGWHFFWRRIARFNFVIQWYLPWHSVTASTPQEIEILFIFVEIGQNQTPSFKDHYAVQKKVAAWLSIYFHLYVFHIFMHF